MYDDDEDSYPEMDEDDFDDCGALFFVHKDDAAAYYHCLKAGTEYCDFDCPFAKEMRQRLYPPNHPGDIP